MWDQMAKSTPLGAVLDAALHEAAQQGSTRVSTDHLLLGLLSAPDSIPARALAVTSEQGRTALDTLDRTALATLGLELDRHGIQAPSLGSRRIPLSRNILTPNAWTAIRRAIDATGVKTRHQAPNHLLRALLSLQPPDPANQLLTQLGIDQTATLNRLTNLEKHCPTG
ncbi:Clp protease N-terminal domain-containing protein [Nocardia sp. CDC153]|uniref:Clp protease N-terminal domain-containing protein n=1 Tax=Nocardia sp. CDC153 TaxID=3112167 RepID=UPI002DC01BD7|nr:Clp protease N-terminal domain-containing protein [Nocardia sp. CDC153]MEC3957843.1 Clp protease N-terminal domain-containing protein [Nocardia sp. CDC153]